MNEAQELSRTVPEIATQGRCADVATDVARLVNILGVDLFDAEALGLEISGLRLCTFCGNVWVSAHRTRQHLEATCKDCEWMARKRRSIR